MDRDLGPSAHHFSSESRIPSRLARSERPTERRRSHGRHHGDGRRRSNIDSGESERGGHGIHSFSRRQSVGISLVRSWPRFHQRLHAHEPLFNLDYGFFDLQQPGWLATTRSNRPRGRLPSPLAQANLPANQSMVIATARLRHSGRAWRWRGPTTPKSTCRRRFQSMAPISRPRRQRLCRSLCRSDATQPGSTQLFVYNRAWYGAANLTITGYDVAGSLIGAVT